MAMAEIIALSHKYGANPDFVLAGGGNTSYKDENFLYIKGSGTTLATITEDGFVKMNRAKLGAMFDRKYSSNTAKREEQVLADMMAAREPSELSKRPSVETLLHNIINYKYIAHTHPAMINGLTCGKRGKAIAKKLWGDQVIWIDLVEPGFVLASVVKKALDEYKEKTGRDGDIILLQNHGIFVAGNTSREVDKKYQMIINAIKKESQVKPNLKDAAFDKERAALLAPAVRMLLRDGGTSVVKFYTNKQVQAFLKDKTTFKPISSAYSPDHIVYCRPEAAYVKAADDMDKQYAALEQAISDYKAKWGFLPKVVAVQGLGYYAWGNSVKNAAICGEVFMDAVKIGAYAQNFGGSLFMTDYMIDFICHWEVESYRSKVSLAGGAAKRLDSKIAIVTGSAQGFGQGIAEHMLMEGCNVVIADLNLELAAANSQAMNEKYGAGHSIALGGNVADEDSVRDMVYNTVLAYGGLDIFVNNAGIAIAGGLEEMTVNRFGLVTNVNYLAYYLCAKYASRIMKIQNRFDKTYMTDIIQINSKSGLEGSKNNFAYAGSKFGGIGLTQSFALELVGWNIKVNCICPGNLLNGPLWSDPVKGLFVQYLKAGKVPGAKTVADVREYYESKVPMHRGCEIIDVARAIFYIVEQEYETGQAIPVTGGQVMLK